MWSIGGILVGGGEMWYVPGPWEGGGVVAECRCAGFSVGMWPAVRLAREAM